MKKNYGKRVVAFFMALLMILGTMAGAELSSVLASDTLFTDDFSSATLAGWNRQDVGIVNSGTYFLSNQEKNAITQVPEQAKLMVSADVTVNMGANSEGLLQNSIASVVAMADKDMTRGYEFGIGVTKTGVTYMRLYLRGDESTSRILVQEYTDIPGVEGGSIDIGKQYKLTLGVYEGLIQCFINDKLAIAFEDSTYTSGFCGVKTAWSKSTFDNVTVKAIEEKKVEKLTLENTPAKVSMVGELDFDVVIDYVGDYHQTERVSADDSRLTITGFARKEGDKTVKVSYGGKTAKFKTTVVKSLEDTLVFSDDFSSLNKDNYAFAQTVREEYGVTYAFENVNGMLKGTVPALPAGYDKNLNATARIDVDGIKNLKNYYATVDATLYKDIGTPTTRRAMAELSAFTDMSGQRYRFRVYSTGSVRLYQESTLLFEKKLASIKGADFSVGKPFNMTMHVTEGMIVCQYNGIDIFHYAAADMNEFTPKITIRAYDGTVSFDNLKVYGVEKYSRDAVKGIKLKTIANSDTVSTCTGRTIDTTKYYLLVTYVNGMKKPVRLTEDMLVGYNPNLKASQSINITYGTKITNLKFTYTEYLFLDTFDKTMSELWNFSTADNITLKVKDSSLKPDWNNVNESASITGQIEGSDEWSNYSVSTDVSFSTSMTKSIRSGSYVSLMLRRTGSTYYDLRLNTRSGNISMSLYQYIDGDKTLVASFTNSQLKGKLAAANVELANGNLYNLKAICKDDTIHMYLNDIMIGSYTNATVPELRQGKVGIKIAKVTATIDNFIVEEKGPRNITKIAVDGLIDNVFEIYEGFEIEAYDYQLNCYDADGTVMAETLTADMISPYDNLEAGMQNITISAHGLKQKAAVKVLQRDDYIKKVEKDLEGLKVSKLTIDEADEVDEILGRYDELSAFEVSKMSEKAVKNAKEARIQVESLRYPDIAKDDVLYTNTFTTESDCKSNEWSNGSEAKRGEWMFINGAYRNEQEYHGISGASQRVLKSVYGQISSVSARFQVLSPGMFAGVMLNVSMEGEYSARIKMNVFDENNEVIPMFQVLKGDTILISEEFKNYGVDIKEREWFDVRLTCVNGVVSAYFNDTMVFSFDDNQEIVNYTEGRAGIVVSRANSKFDNFVVRGVETGVPTSVAKPTPTEYKDDFQDEAVNANPNYWIEHPSTDDWKTVSKDGNTYYGTKAKDTQARTWIHVHEKNPTVSFEFMYDATKKDADIGFYVRQSPETAYVKVGYNPALQKWYLLDTEAERDSKMHTEYSKKEYSLKENEWHKLQIVGDGNYISLTVDGETIFDKIEVVQVGYGRIGAYCTNSALYIDNVKMEFPNGDVPQDGLIEYKIHDEFYDACVDMTVLDDDNIIGLGSYGSYFSKDGGESFDIIGGASAADEDVVEQYVEITDIQGYKSAMKLHDGSYLYIHEEDYIVKKSTDSMKTWTDIGRVVPEDYLTDKQGRGNVSTHNNSLTEFQLEDGTWRLFLPVAVSIYPDQLATSVSGHYTEIYYSDDGGATWQKSKTDSRDFSTDYNRVGGTTEWAETKIIQCSDGSFRIYLSRAKYGCMQYSVSRDGGVTWEGQYAMPEFQVAKSSFSLVQDKTNGYYYMVFVNNNPVRVGGTFNRTRLTLVRSKDGMNWEFVCDLERMSEEIYGDSHTSSTPLLQMVDPGIEVDGDYVYVTVGLSEGSDVRLNTGGQNYHQGLRPWLWRIEKDKLNARAWDASTVNDMMFVKSIEVTTPSKVRFGYGDMFSYIGGEVTATRLDGTTYTMDTARLYLYEEPDMFTLGKHTVVLYNGNGTKTSYEIEVVNKYAVTWVVNGEGTIDPQVNGVLEGDDLEVTIKPRNFFQKAIVKVNGERVRLRAGKLVQKEVMEELIINVDFVQKGVMDYLFYITLGLLIALGGTVGVLYYKKKKATNTKQEAVNETE